MIAEGKTIEFKREYMDDIKYAVIAFANTEGGKLYIGINDDGTVCGVDDVDDTMLRLTNMIRETSGDCYEDARSVNQQLTFEKATAYFSKKNLEFSDTKKRTLNIIGSDGTYTNLGMLLSDQCIHTIKLAVFEGSKKSIFKDRKELTGSLLEQLEDAYTYIDQFNHTRAEFEGLDRIDKRDYPAEALREALLNAIVHRDYSVSGSTLISIFDDRIEFVTIGGLVRGISYDDIQLGVSALRNKKLADVFYRLKLIEAYGTGIMKINECYAEELVKPDIKISNNAFKITLPNLNYDHETEYFDGMNDRTKKVLSLFKTKDQIVRRDVDKVLGTSQSTSSILLRQMIDDGILKKLGKGKSLTYKLR